MTIEEVKAFLTNPNIEIQGLRRHSKASEEYVDVAFHYPDRNGEWHGSIPFQYWRAGIEIHDPQELAQFIELFYEPCAPGVRDAWVQKQQDLWNSEFTERKTTKPFFDTLLNLGWNCTKCQLPRNPNSQSRIRDIKVAGYLLATHTSRFCSNCRKRTTQHLLIPGSNLSTVGYEIISEKLRQRIISVLDATDVYEARKVPSASRNRLIPDHKFPEVRWDTQTKSENHDTMSEEEIRKKFQLLDNRRNLQKTQVCRQCFQTNKRGKVYGIDYYYQGGEDWPIEIKRGREAEAGCVGCPWYDLQEWRESLNRLLEGNQLQPLLSDVLQTNSDC